MDIFIFFLQVLSIAAIACIFIFKNYLFSYSAEKAKNLATKEDVATITNKIESVKTEYAKSLEELRRDNQLILDEIEREKSIKREVYLQAVEALSRILNIITSFANLDITEQEISNQIRIDSGLIAKTQVVGSERTVKAVTSIMSTIGRSALELMLERAPLIERKFKIELAEKYRTKSADEIDKYISMMKEASLARNFDKQLWETINNDIEFNSQQRDEYSDEKNKLWSIQNNEHLVFAKKCMDKHFEVASLLPEAVLSIRDELGLGISDDAYLNIFNSNLESGKLAFNDFLEKLSKS